MLDLPVAADASLPDRWQTELPFEWSPPSSGVKDAVSRPKVTLAVTGLTPGWYHLNVWIDGDSALVTGRMRYVETRLGELPIKLEPRRAGRFSKILKIAEPVSSVTIAVDGARAKSLSRIEIRRLGLPTVCVFIARKGVRYLMANRHGLDLAAAFKQLTAAFQTRANFAFRASYEPEDIEAAYPRWRAIHEDPFACQRAASTLERRLAPGRARVALLVPDGFDPAVAAEEVGSSLLSPVVDLVPVPLAAGSPSPLESYDFLLPVDHAGRMRRGGVERMVLALTEDRGLSGVYADSDTVNHEGVRGQPRLKPPADRELLWCTDYIRAPLLVRAEPDLVDALAAPGVAQSPAYALALALIERDHGALGHIPEILFHEFPDSPRDRKRAPLAILQQHLERGSGAGTVTARTERESGQVVWPVPHEAASVSIIIPSKDKPELLEACIDSIRARTTGIVPQIIVADNGSTLPAARAYLDAIAAEGAATVVPCPGPFNFPKINNQARRHADGRILVLLNDDTQVVSPNWLTELASLACRPEVGAVGSKLLYPDGTIQHAGVVLGIGGAGDHAFRYMPGDAPGYLDLIRCRREVSAVTGACLAVSAAHSDLVGGIDELPVTLNDVDFCLRLRDRGLINIWTPWAVLEHWESKSRGTDHTDAALDRQAAELGLFTRRRGHLMAQDPNYHPGLSRSEPDYRLAV